MTGLRKISGNNKHSVVLSSDIKEASFVTQTLTSHHVCNRGGFFCLQISSHSRIMRARHFQRVTYLLAYGWAYCKRAEGPSVSSSLRLKRETIGCDFGLIFVKR